MVIVKAVDGIEVGEELHPLGISECPFCESEDVDTESTGGMGDPSYDYFCNDCEFTGSVEMIHKVIHIKTPPLTEDSDWCVCADCSHVAKRWIEDKTTRVENHCGCWAECKNCNTLTGVEKCPC